MAQGAIKSTKRTAPAKPVRGKGVQGAKWGARTYAPKKQALIKNAKAAKKLSAGLTAMTERQLAGKAGHLELLKGGKKDRAKGVKPATGGTKKFG